MPHVPLNIPLAPQDASAPSQHACAPVFVPPSFPSACSSCNLWLNGPSSVTSTMHFDSQNNFLCMCDPFVASSASSSSPCFSSSPSPPPYPSHLLYLFHHASPTCNNHTCSVSSHNPSPPNSFHGNKTLHLHPPSSSLLASPWSHTPNAPSARVRCRLMQSDQKITAELQKARAISVVLCARAMRCNNSPASHFHN
jgi:hypothetical protein